MLPQSYPLEVEVNGTCCGMVLLFAKISIAHSGGYASVSWLQSSQDWWILGPMALKVNASLASWLSRKMHQGPQCPGVRPLSHGWDLKCTALAALSHGHSGQSSSRTSDCGRVGRSTPTDTASQSGGFCGTCLASCKFFSFKSSHSIFAMEMNLAYLFIQTVLCQALYPLHRLRIVAKSLAFLFQNVLRCSIVLYNDYVGYFVAVASFSST